MGIPLYNILEVPRFFGRDMYSTNPIDFMKKDYRPLESHIIAARIKDENPDEGFKPTTSGSIERIKFRSTSNAWGYLSFGTNGGIQEFANSQFGDLFARGVNRGQARMALILALKGIEVWGNIVTTVVKLLETNKCIDNH
jgi:acetyl-CoA carboxylase / biotin carboxylase 1